jgi:PEP-CTERM motif
MEIIKSFVVAMAVLALPVVTSHAQLTLNFSSSPGGATIQFNGSSSSFQFNASTTPLFIPFSPPVTYYLGSQWTITSVVGGTGSALNLLGAVNNGPFHYGSITTITNGSGVDESANVTGPLGALRINDNAGNFLTGNVDWVQITTHDFAGAINAALTVDVTGVSYAGINPDLVALFAGSPAAMNLTFQFSPGMRLTDLTAGSGPYVTSYSGSLAVASVNSVPEPSTLVLAGLGGLSVLLLCRWEKRNAS